MKIGKKLTLLLLTIFSSLVLVTACSKDPYKNMALVVSSGNSVVQEYSDNDDENFFDITATVTGVDGKDVDTTVQFVSSNPSIVAAATGSPSVNGNSSTQKFKVLNTGHVTIRVSTIEGGNSGIKTQDVDVQITRKLDSLAFSNVQIPVLRGVATDVLDKVYDGSTLINFTPYNTTDRMVTLTCVDSVTLEPITEGVEIDGSVIKVTSEYINSFTLLATSVSNNEITASAVVDVVDPVAYDDFTLQTVTNNGEVISVPKTIVGDDSIYTINLSSNGLEANDYLIQRIEVLKDGMSIDSLMSLYTLSAKDLNSSGTGVNGLNYSSARKDMGESFTISEGRGIGVDILTLLVRYKGYENIFAPVEIPVRVVVSAYPTTINFVSSMEQTEGVDVINVYNRDNYENLKGTVVSLQIRNTNGNLINQTAYVYAANQSDHSMIEKGVLIYHFVNGAYERVYSTTPIKHGEKLYIHYVLEDGFNINGNYELVAYSTYFPNVHSYDGENAGKHQIKLIQSEVNVYMPAKNIRQGGTEELDASILFGTINPEIRVCDLTVTSSDTSIVQIVYDYDRDIIILDTSESTKIGEAQVRVVAPNGVWAAGKIVVYTNTSADNTFIKLGGKTLTAGNEESINVLANGQLSAYVVIKGVEYDNLINKLPQGILVEVVDDEESPFPRDYVSVGGNGINLYMHDANIQCGVTYRITNTYDGDEFEYRVQLVIARVVTELQLNQTLVPILYSTNSIHMEEYEDYKLHKIIATPVPAQMEDDDDYTGTFSFKVSINGELINLDELEPENIFERSGYTIFTFNQDYLHLYVKAYTTNEKLMTGEFDVTHTMQNRENEPLEMVDTDKVYQIVIHLSYECNYTNIGETFTAKVSNYVQINARNAVRVTSISTDLNNSNVLEFNTNEMTMDNSGKPVSGNVKVFSFALSPKDKNIFVDTVLIRKGARTNLTEKSTSGHITIYTNSYLKLEINNYTKTIIVTITEIPTDKSLLTQNFKLVSKDSVELTGRNVISTDFKVKINDGTSIDSAFVITTPEQLLLVNNSLSSYYRLGADISLLNYSANGAWSPIGDEGHSFTGWFSGEYDNKIYSISNLRIVNPHTSSDAAKLGTNAIGLFAVNDGVIENLNINDFLIRVNYGNNDLDNLYVGAVAGINRGYIENVTVTSSSDAIVISSANIMAIQDTINPTSGIVVFDYTVTAHDSFVGGVTGVNMGYIKNCPAYVQIYAKDSSFARVVAGGVAGANTTLSQNRLEAMQAEYNSRNTFSGKYNMLHRAIIIPWLVIDGTVNSQIENSLTELNTITDAELNNMFTETERNIIYQLRTIFGQIITGTISEQLQQDYFDLQSTYADQISTNLGYVEKIAAYYNVLKSTSGVNKSGSILFGENTNDSYNVVFAFNQFDADDELVLINAGSAVGGVVGLNNISLTGRINQPTVSGAVVRAYIVGYNNVGGVAGINQANITECVTQVNIIANNYVGGIAGRNLRQQAMLYTLDMNLQYTYSNKISYGIITNCKVQFVNYLDSYSAFNTAIYADAQVGGLVGFSGEWENPSVDTYAFNSVYSYVSRDRVMSAGYTADNQDGLYYGDVVAREKVGGLIGYASNCLYMNNCLVLANIYVTENNYVGGVVGVVNKVIRLQQIQVDGRVVGSTKVGGFVGDASSVLNKTNNEDSDSTNDAVAIVASYTVIKANGSYVGNLAYNSPEKLGVTYNALYIGETVKDYNNDDLLYNEAASQNVETYTRYTYTSNAEGAYVYDNTLGKYRLATSEDVGAERFSRNAGAGLKQTGDYKNFLVYDGTEYVTGYGDDISSEYNYYYNQSLFDGRPVSFSDVSTRFDADGNVALVYDVAPTSIAICSKEGYTLNGSTSAAVLVYAKHNSYRISSVLDVQIEPKFAHSKFAVISSDDSILRIQDGMFVPKSAGKVTITYTSLLDASITASIDVYIYNATNWNLLSDSGAVVSGNINVVKGYSTTLSSTFKPLLNVAANEIVGFRAVYDSAYESHITINGIANPDYEYLGTMLVIQGLEEFNSSHKYITIEPFVVIDGQKIYLGRNASFTVTVVLGNFETFAPDSVTIDPTKIENFSIVVRTDNPDLGYYFVTNSTDAEPTATNSILKQTYVGQLANDSDPNYVFKWANNSRYENGYMYFDFEVWVNSDYYNVIKSNIVYTYTFETLLYDETIDVKQFTVTLIPQGITSIITTNYSRIHYVDVADNVASDSEEAVVSAYKYESNTIVPGFAGLLQIDVNPWYGRFDYVDVTTTAYGLAFEQMVETTNNGQFGEYSRYEGYFSIENGIRIYDVKGVQQDGVEQYDGRLFVRTNSAAHLQHGYVAITISCYLEDGTLVKRVVKDNIYVVEAPRVVITTKDETKYGVIAAGCSTTFNVKFYGDPDTITCDSVINLHSGVNTYTHTFDDVGTLYASLGKSIPIKVEVSKVINGTLYKGSDTITLRVVKFEINSISVDNVENGYFVGKYNQIYKLKTRINATYNKSSQFWVDDVEHDLANLANSLDGYGLNNRAFDYYGCNVRYYDESVGTYVTNYTRFVVDTDNTHDRIQDYIGFYVTYDNVYTLVTEDNKDNLSIVPSVTTAYKHISSTGDYKGYWVLANGDYVQVTDSNKDQLGINPAKTIAFINKPTSQLTMQNVNDGVTHTWNYIAGNSIEPLETKQYINFTVRNSYKYSAIDNTITDEVASYSIQNTNVYAHDVLACIAQFTYTLAGVPVITTQIHDDTIYDGIYDDNESYGLYTYYFENRFTFNFSRITAEETPDPIYNVEQFLKMQTGGYYILENDLVLDNWIPMNANFASLDGNMHTITINSFASIADMYGEATGNIEIGLFKSVENTYDSSLPYNSCTIQNLNVEILQDITIDARGYSNVKFGIIAGSNSGVITNSRVVNNAGESIAERLEIIKYMLPNNKAEALKILNNYHYATVQHQIVDEQDKYIFGDLQNDKRVLNTILNEVAGFDALVKFYMTEKTNNEGYEVPNEDICGLMDLFDNNFIIWMEATPGFQNFKSAYEAIGSIDAFIETYYNEFQLAYKSTIVYSAYEEYWHLMQVYVEYVYNSRQANDILTSEHVLTNYRQLLNKYVDLFDINNPSHITEIVIDNVRYTNYNDATFAELVSIPKCPQVYIMGNDQVSQNNYIAGFAGSNDGYITNSSIDDVSIKGIDYVAGFVGSNSGAISTSYFRGGNVISVDSNSKANSATAGFVVDNTVGATIQYSYVQGRYVDSVTELSETILDTLPGYNAYKVYTDPESNQEKIDTVNKFAMLRAFGSVVRTNTFSSGFVYKNAGTVNDSYSNIIVTGLYSAGFVYDNTSEKAYVQNNYSMSSGSGNFYGFTKKSTGSEDRVKDCYYLVVDEHDTGVADYYDKNKMSNLDSVEGTQLGAISFKDYNAFQSYAFNTDYNINSEQTVVNNVWFIPTEGTIGAFECNTYFNYFKHNNTNMINKTYKYDAPAREDVHAYTSYTLNMQDTSYAYNRPELVAANLRYTRYRMYYEDLSKEKGFDYFEADSRYGLGVDNNKLSMQYGATVINPYCVDTAIKFNSYSAPNTSSTPDTGSTDIADNDVTTAYMRVIRNIVFDESTQTATTYKTKFNGNLDGNGLKIENLRILAASEEEGEEENNNFAFGLFAYIEGGNVRNININVAEIWGANVPVVGVLAGVITDNETEVDGEIVRIPSNITNVNITAQNNVIAQGLNVVGGIAGIVEGQTYLINCSSAMPVKANYRGSVNMFSAQNAVNTTHSTYKLVDLSGISNYITDSDSQSAYENISYAGGIAGIVNVKDILEEQEEVTLRSFARIRRNHINQGIIVSGQIVGGLYGYVGTSTQINDGYVLADENTMISATRVAGGLVGENLGTIKRSYVAHTAAIQKTIDNYIGANSSSSSGSGNVDNATRDILISGVQYEVFKGNPHYIGGLVGMNLNGEIAESYNKVPVCNINAEYAGGIVGVNVGGKLDTLYVTATVYAFRAIGGVVGLQTEVTNTAKRPNDNTKTCTAFNNKQIPYSQQFSGYEQMNEEHVAIGLNGVYSDNTTIHNLVVTNVWLYSHLNVNRSMQYEANASNAKLGTIAGVSSVEFNGDITDDFRITYGGFKSDKVGRRLVNETNYVKATYTFDSVGSTASDLVPEIGAMPYYKDGFNNKVTAQQIFYNTINTLSDCASGYASTSASTSTGEIIKLNRRNDAANVNPLLISGYYKISGLEEHIVSRMSALVSYRSLNEIIERKSYSDPDAKNFYEKYALKRCSDGQGSAPFTESFNEHDKFSRIYYDWSILDWSGVELGQDGNKIESEYIFPDLSNKAERYEVLVWDIHDLMLMNRYLYADFILQDNITCDDEYWSAVGTEEHPFCGKVYSAKNTQGEQQIFAIQHFVVDISSENTGLVAYAKDAKFHHFIIEYIGYDTEDFTSDNMATSNASILLAHATDTDIDNVTIRLSPDATTTKLKQIVNKRVENFGMFVAVGSGVTITNCTLGYPSAAEKAVIKATSNSREDNAALYFGGVFGKLIDGGDNENWIDNVNVCNYDIDIIAQQENNAVNVGIVGGRLLITPQKSYVTNIVNPIDATQKTHASVSGTDIKIELQNNAPESLPDLIAIGGMYGYTHAYTNEMVSVEFTGLSYGGKITINGDENNNSKYVGGIFGYAIGGKYTEIQSTGSIDCSFGKTNTNSSTVSQYLYIGGIFGNANNVNASSLLSATLIKTMNAQSVATGIIAGLFNNSSAADFAFVKNSAGIILDYANKSSDNKGGINYIGGAFGKVYQAQVSRTAVDNIQILIADTISKTFSYNILNIGGAVGYVYGSSSITQSMTNAKIITTINSITSAAKIGGFVGEINPNSSITTSYSTGYIDVTNKVNYYVYIGGFVGYDLADSNVINISDCYTISNIIFANNDQFSNNNNKHSFAGKNTSKAKNDYAAFELNPQFGQKPGATNKTLEDMFTGTLTFENTDVFVQNDHSFPLLSWIKDMNGSSFGYSVASSVQAIGTKQNPKVNPSAVDGVTSAYFTNGTLNFGAATTVKDSYIILSDNAQIITSMSAANISKESIVIGLNNTSGILKPTNAGFVNSNFGKIIGLKIYEPSDPGTKSVVDVNEGYIFNCDFGGCKITSVIGNYFVIENSTLFVSDSPYNMLHNTNSRIITSKMIYGFTPTTTLTDSIMIDSYMTWGDNCRYVNTNSTTSPYIDVTFNEAHDLDFGEIPVDLEKFVLDPTTPGSENPTGMTLKLKWELQDHWYDDDIKASYRWDSVGEMETNVTNKYIVHNAVELAQFANMWNEHLPTESVELIIAADIDLAGKLWTPIYKFTGTIRSAIDYTEGDEDGRSHIISNLTIYSYKTSYNSGCRTGFITSTNGDVTIQDISFEYASVMSSYNSIKGLRSAVLIGSVFDNVTIDKVAVNNAAVFWGAGFIGDVHSAGIIKITDSYLTIHRGNAREFVAIADQVSTCNIIMKQMYAVTLGARHTDGLTYYATDGSANIIDTDGIGVQLIGGANVYVALTNWNEFFATASFNIANITADNVYVSLDIFAVKNTCEPTLSPTGLFRYYSFPSYNHKALTPKIEGSFNSGSGFRGEYFEGFAWGTTWWRSTATNDPHSNYPQLSTFSSYWQDYARKASVTSPTDYEISDSTIIVKTAKGLAYAALQLSIEPSDSAYNSVIGSIASPTIMIQNNVNMGERFWRPITFASRYNGKNVSFRAPDVSGAHSTITGLIANSDTSNGFVGTLKISSTKSLGGFSIKDLTFDKAQISTYGAEGSAQADTGVILGDNNEKNFSIYNVTISNSTVVCELHETSAENGIAAGILVAKNNCGAENNIKGITITNCKITAKNTKYVGGVVGYVYGVGTAAKFNNIAVDNIIVTSTYKTYLTTNSCVGGMFGYYKGYQDAGISGFNNVQVNAKHIVNVGGYFGEVDESDLVGDSSYGSPNINAEICRYVGGIAGCYDASNKSMSNWTYDSTNAKIVISGSAPLTNNSYVGGIVGFAPYSSVTECAVIGGIDTITETNSSKFNRVAIENKSGTGYKIGGVIGYFVGDNSNYYAGNLYFNSGIDAVSSADYLIGKVSDSATPLAFGLCIAFGSEYSSSTGWIMRRDNTKFEEKDSSGYYKYSQMVYYNYKFNNSNSAITTETSENKEHIAIGGSKVNSAFKFAISNSSAFNLTSNHTGYAYGNYSSSYGNDDVIKPKYNNFEIPDYKTWRNAYKEYQGNSTTYKSINSQSDLDMVRIINCYRYHVTTGGNDQPPFYLKLESSITLNSSFRPLGYPQYMFRGAIDGNYKQITMDSAYTLIGFGKSCNVEKLHFIRTRAAKISYTTIGDITYDYSNNAYYGDTHAYYGVYDEDYRDSTYIGSLARSIGGGTISEVGYNLYMETSDYNTTTTHTHVGGLIGAGWGLKLSKCYLEGDFTFFVDSGVGRTSNTAVEAAQRAYYTQNKIHIVNANNVGGLIGTLQGYNSPKSSITDCVLSFMIDVWGDWENRYTGGVYINTTNSAHALGGVAGGLVGSAINADITNCIVSPWGVYGTNAGGIVGNVDGGYQTTVNITDNTIRFGTFDWDHSHPGYGFEGVEYYYEGNPNGYDYVDDSYFGTIYGTNNVGGIVGRVEYGKTDDTEGVKVYNNTVIDMIRDANANSNADTIVSKNIRIVGEGNGGGLIGYAYGSNRIGLDIDTNDVNYTEIAAENNDNDYAFGGIIGKSFSDTQSGDSMGSEIKVNACNVTYTSVEGGSYVGGIIGSMEIGQITNCKFNGKGNRLNDYIWSSIRSYNLCDDNYYHATYAAAGGIVGELYYAPWWPSSDGNAYALVKDNRVYNACISCANHNGYSLDSYIGGIIGSYYITSFAELSNSNNCGIKQNWINGIKLLGSIVGGIAGNSSGDIVSNYAYNIYVQITQAANAYSSRYNDVYGFGAIVGVHSAHMYSGGRISDNEIGNDAQDGGGNYYNLIVISSYTYEEYDGWIANGGFNLAIGWCFDKPKEFRFDNEGNLPDDVDYGSSITCSNNKVYYDYAWWGATWNHHQLWHWFPALTTRPTINYSNNNAYRYPA